MNEKDVATVESNALRAQISCKINAIQWKSLFKLRFSHVLGWRTKDSKIQWTSVWWPQFVAYLLWDRFKRGRTTGRSSRQKTIANIPETNPRPWRSSRSTTLPYRCAARDSGTLLTCSNYWIGTLLLINLQHIALYSMHYTKKALEKWRHAIIYWQIRNVVRERMGDDTKQ